MVSSEAQDASVEAVRTVETHRKKTQDAPRIRALQTAAVAALHRVTMLSTSIMAN